MFHDGYFQAEFFHNEYYHLAGFGTTGPYIIDASSMFVPGSAVEQIYTPGVDAARILS